MDCQFEYLDDTDTCIHYIHGAAEPGFCKRDREFHCVKDLKEGDEVGMENTTRSTILTEAWRVLEDKYRLSVSGYNNFVHCRQSWYFAYLANGTGIAPKPQYLPLMMRCGRVWDHIQNDWYSEPLPINLITKSVVNLCDNLFIPDDAVVKLTALAKAWYTLDFDIPIEGASVQHKFQIDINNIPVTGVIDVKYPNFIVENKLSGRPDMFQTIFPIRKQAGIYLLSDPQLKGVIVRAVRFPQHKIKTKNNQVVEDYDEFGDRIYKDIISRPSHYFLNYNRKDHKFGYRYHRGEFDLDGLQEDFANVYSDIQSCLSNHKLCYADELSCHAPAECLYFHICSTGGVSSEIYEPRDRKG